MLWNEQTQLLESVFRHALATIRLPRAFRLPSSSWPQQAHRRRENARVPGGSNDVTEDSALHIRCENRRGSAFPNSSCPLLMQDRLIGVLDLENTEPQAFTLGNTDTNACLSTPWLLRRPSHSRMRGSMKKPARVKRRLREDLDTARENPAPTVADRRAGSAGSRSSAAGYVSPRAEAGLETFYDFFCPTDRVASDLCWAMFPARGTASGAVWLPGNRHTVSRNRCRPCMRAGLACSPF